MRKTNFYNMHKNLNAKMVEFAGFEMPIQYLGGIISEHLAVRNKVGVFDVSHMGEFKVTGPDALAFVQKVTINDASKLKRGHAQYSAMCYEDGGIVDDLLVYNMGPDGYLMVVNGANVDKNWNWLNQHTAGYDIAFMNITEEVSLLAIQGPNSLDTLKGLTELDIALIPFYHFLEGQMCGEYMLVSRTGYTGELGFELYFRGGVDVAEKVWNMIMEAGKPYGIEAVGLGARDTLRLEKGYALYGNDITAETNPLEGGLGWITKLTKGDFIGRDALVKIQEDKPNRRLVGFIVEAEKFIARSGYKIYADGRQIGYVTSGNLSPSLKVPIGMGYVESAYKNPSTRIQIEARGKMFDAEIRKMPLL